MTINQFDIRAQRDHFPILKTQVQGKPLVYFDNAATTQKPQVVLDAMHHFYTYSYSSVHRGIYTLSEKATEQFEKARAKVQHFIGAKRSDEIVFTRGTTESINLVAQSYLKPKLEPNDEILISHMEHHANIVPWQTLCADTGAILKVIPLNSDGSLDLSNIDNLLNERTRLVGITHLSNVLGILNPIQSIIEKAHQKGAVVLIDGAQAISHFEINVATLNCDFYVFSGHKMYGPTGIGVLYGKINHLANMPPWQVGGGMIRQVSFERTEYCEPPHRFEAGTPPIAEAIGLGAAIDYLSMLDRQALVDYEKTLYAYMLKSLETIPSIKIFSKEALQCGTLLSIALDQVHAHDIATILSGENVAVRAGHHCAMPLMKWLGVAATVRVSLGLYNTTEEVDLLVKGLKKAEQLFAN